jgi:hypothetical protein
LIFCHDTQFLGEDRGIITDGSGTVNYANNCSCKWQVTAKGNQRIHIRFTALDTQPNVDYIWIFDGTETLQENLMAKFSGNNLPPEITSLSNQVLIWFVTDSHVTGKGWSCDYAPVEK